VGPDDGMQEAWRLPPPGRRRTCCRSVEQLARIEDAVGVEYLLDPAHQRDLRLAAGAGQVRLLDQADAVLGGDTAAMSLQGLGQQLGHLLALGDEVRVAGVV